MKNDGLTMVDAWDRIKIEYPKAFEVFSKWINNYKVINNWSQLFRSSLIKYHDLTYGMQQGIFIDFCKEILNHYFEQPEYEPSLDFEEDIKNVFNALEEIL